MEQAFAVIESKIVEAVNAKGGRSLWAEIMRPLGLYGPCGPNNTHMGYASGFFVERLKEQGQIQVHQSAAGAIKYLVTKIHPDFRNNSIRRQ